MAVQHWCWLRPLAVVLVLLRIHGTAAARFQDGTYSHDTMKEIADIPVESVTRLCVVPLDDNTRLKVRHTDAAGGRKEVLVKKKSLSADALTVLEIGVETGGADKAILGVRLNGTKLQPPDTALRPTSPPLQPRTTLLLKGNAVITNCTATKEERVVLNTHAKQTVVAGREGEVTEGQEGEVTEEHGGKVTEGEGGKVTDGHVTEDQGGKVTEEQGGEVTSPNASQPPLPSTTTNVTNATETDDPGFGEEPWWSFLLVLGKVGEVPVLLLLLACLVVGLIVGSILVCLCSKMCQKRRVEYLPVSTMRTHCGHLAGDIVRDPKFWDTISNQQRSSGIGSAYSTLNTDNGSNMGTANSRGTGTKLAGNANNSIDPSTKAPIHNGVNNLGRAPTGSPSNSINRSHNSSGNMFNIPPGSMKSSGSGRSWDNRDVDRSPRLTQGSSVRRTPSNRSTSSSLNRNTNRSPNIPYTNKLGILTGHQDIPMLQKPVNRLHASDDDSDDSWYDKPYISSPLVAENYSVPHVSATEPVLVEVRTASANNNDPNARQVPVFQFGTFKK